MITIVNRTSRYLYDPSAGLLFIRVALGVLFFTHGLMKVQALSNTLLMFSHFGFYPWVGFCIAWLELLGGLALILGIATRIFGFLFGVEMLVAAVFIVGFGRGINTELILSLISFALLFAGSGKYSVFRMEHGEGNLFRVGDEVIAVVE